MVFEILVTVLGILMSLAYYPQAYKIYKNKTSGDISLLTYIIFSIGTTVWFLWGVITSSLPIILGFFFGMIGSNLVLILSIHYKNSKNLK